MFSGTMRGTGRRLVPLVRERIWALTKARTSRGRLWLACAGMVSAVLCASASAAQASVTHHGYLTAPDGSSLNYTVVLPSAQGRFPVVMVYDGYSAGYQPMTDNGDAAFMTALAAKGFAVMGVNVPGTGCSSGSIYPPFGKTWAKDGAAAVTWAASQSWSTGKVGMLGASFPGFMALYVAAERPRGLVAIAPTGWTGNFYDAVWPGGIYDDVFPNLFDADQLNGSIGNVQSGASNGDVQCPVNFGQTQGGRVPGQNGGPPVEFVAVQAPQHPYYDTIWTDQLWELQDAIPNIQVPVLTLNAYQDQIASGTGSNYSSLLDPHQSWFILTNGWHAIGNNSKTWTDETVAFLDHFVAGANNGWRTTPKVQIWHETGIENSLDVEPRWTTSEPSWPPVTTTGALDLRSGNLLSQYRPAPPEAPDSYQYPMPAGSMGDPRGMAASASAPSNNLWAQPVPSGGNVSYTTPPLSKDLDIVGPSSLNVWLSSTATDTDMQATVTEVRPDGQEQYVQRGWLRLSKRKLGSDSTATWPRPTYQQADAQPLEPGAPTYARIPIYPFEHIFRRGSSIRISIEAPVGTTGDFGFLYNTTSATNTVLHDQHHVSQWVFDTLPITKPVPTLSVCDSIIEEPCRTNTEAVPSKDVGGTGPATPTGVNSAAGSVCASNRVVSFTLPKGARNVRLTVAGKSVKPQIHNGMLRLSIKGLPAGTVKVVITAKAGSRRYRRTATLHTCRRGIKNAVACSSRRVVTMHLPRGATNVRLVVNGRRRKVAPRARSIKLSLVGIHRQTVIVRITATVNDQRYRRTSTLHPCKSVANAQR